MNKTSALHHASLTTSDLDRLVEFYRDKFEFEVVMTTEWEAGNARADAIFGLKDTSVRMAMLRLPNAFLELFEFRAPKGRPNDPERPVCDQGFTHVCITVQDIDVAYERLKAAGVAFNCPPQHMPGLCSATYLRDPDGNLVELMTPDPDGPFALG